MCAKGVERKGALLWKPGRCSKEESEAKGKEDRKCPLDLVHGHTLLCRRDRDRSQTAVGNQKWQEGGTPSRNTAWRGGTRQGSTKRRVWAHRPHLPGAHNARAETGIQAGKDHDVVMAAEGSEFL